jgi:Mg-chelatase subunit ChlD
MKRYRFALFCGLAMLTLWLLGRGDADEPAQGPAAKPTADVDLVLCLDTSNSMDGLIEAAKQKLWDLVNTLAKAQPTPRLRVALYSYGNDGYDASIGWVRKELDFTSDLDQVFKKLFDLKTNGGTEYVARVCRDAIRDLKWSPKQEALKMLFVCGNEPATQDPTLTLAEIANQAAKAGIVINPIYCGGADDSDARSWRELALLAKGRFANIDQAQKVAIVTPFDKKLADLADAVNATYIPYGLGGEARLKDQKEQTKNSAGLGVANLAARVTTQNSALYLQTEWDLVDRFKNDKKFDLAKLSEKELPEKLRAMKPQERLQYVQDKLKEREAIQKQVEELSRQRQDYLREERQKNAPAAAVRFDAQLDKTIREQAEAKKISIPK